LNQRVDARADIYALGCLLFESLTGEPPFARGSDGLGMLAHVDAPPPSPRALRPELPAEFDEVVRRAMAKDPEDRYPSAGDLGQAALVAAGGLRRAGRESIVAMGAAAPGAFASATEAPPAGAPAGEASAAGAAAGARTASAAETDSAGRAAPWRWAVALAGLVLVVIGMIGALHGISTL
jgi:serine/threonine-protein kinase